MALLAECVEAGTNDAEIFGAAECAKAAGYFLLHFWHTDGAFTKIVGERHSRIEDKSSTASACCRKRRSRLKATDCLQRPRLPACLTTSGSSRSPSQRIAL